MERGKEQVAAKRQALLPAEETALFCEQVALALEAGIPLYDVMETLKITYATDRYGARFTQMFETVRATGTLRAAVEEAGIFPAYAVGMIGVGEQTGKLDTVLAALGRYYRWEAEVRTSVQNAVVYPVVLAVMLAVVVAVLVISVLPVFERVFANLGVTAGSTGANAIGTAFLIGKVALALIALVLLGGLVLAGLLRGKHSRAVMEWLLRTVPALARADEKLAASRLSNVLSTMFAAGSRVDTAMEIAPQVIQSRRYQQRIQKAMLMMYEGATFAQAADQTGLFDAMHNRMVRFGEQTGKLDAVMEEVRALYQQEADASINALVSGIEPALVAVLSVVIGGVLLTVMVPLLTVLSALG